jgi:hypothetical protein
MGLQQKCFLEKRSSFETEKRHVSLDLCTKKRRSEDVRHDSDEKSPLDQDQNEKVYTLSGTALQKRRVFPMD